MPSGVSEEGMPTVGCRHRPDPRERYGSECRSRNQGGGRREPDRWCDLHQGLGVRFRRAPGQQPQTDRNEGLQWSVSATPWPGFLPGNRDWTVHTERQACPPIIPHRRLHPLARFRSQATVPRVAVDDHGRGLRVGVRLRPTLTVKEKGKTSNQARPRIAPR